MWEKGTRVKIIGGAKIGIGGTVVIDNAENHLNDTRDRFLVEFDEPMVDIVEMELIKGNRDIVGGLIIV